MMNAFYMGYFLSYWLFIMQLIKILTVSVDMPGCPLPDGIIKIIKQINTLAHFYKTLNFKSNIKIQRSWNEG